MLLLLAGALGAVAVVYALVAIAIAAGKAYGRYSERREVLRMQRAKQAIVRQVGSELLYRRT